MPFQRITFDAAISGFPQAIRDDLRDVLSKGGVIPSERVAEWLDALHGDVGNLMIRLLPVAAAYARAPISDFHVGVVALGLPPARPTPGPGHLYLGANMEFPGQVLGFSVHGEQSAVNNAWLHGERGLQAVAINAAPCGHCRQFLYELKTAAELDVFLRAGADPEDFGHTKQPLADFLPDAFGPADLGVEGGLMTPESHGLTIPGGSATAQAALEGANASYAPYTHGHSGVALEAPDGTIYAGRYAENAAYNPSLPPILSALAFMNLQRPAQAPFEVAKAVLVEAPAAISQRDTTAAVLAAVAPSVTLEVVPARAG